MIHIALFPLQIFPLPGELVPLHIFEPRYRQLLSDAQESGFKFGILLQNKNNQNRYGSIVELDRIVRRHPGGESDIIVRCLDFFRLVEFETNFGNKPYPGGSVLALNEDVNKPATPKLAQQFEQLQAGQKYPMHAGIITMFQIANALHLNIRERIALAELSAERRVNYLSGRIDYEIKLAEAAKRSSKVFHLN
jgi:hypothetical protein